MTLQSRILKTKKRLSDQSWLIQLSFIALLTVFLLIIVYFKSFYNPKERDLITSEFPVVSIPYPDKTLNNYKESPNVFIDKTTTVVLITLRELYFGDIESFTSQLYSVTNKYQIPHKDGAPNIVALIEGLDTWFYQRISQENIKNNGILILIPTKEIPMPIVIQMISYLKKSTRFSRVILGGGII